MKTFYTDGTGSEQTLNDSQTEKVVVYDTVNDAEADLANLAEGQIIATKDEDFVDNATPVDEVTLNNMHSVTSNAVAKCLSYSTTEHIVGVWVDGVTPVYEKTFIFEYTNSGTYNQSVSIPSNIDKIVFLGGVTNSPTYCMPIPFNDDDYNTTFYNYVNCNVSSHLLYFSSNQTAVIATTASMKAYITLRYTKTA